jgi:hypothetical protein
MYVRYVCKIRRLKNMVIIILIRYSLDVGMATIWNVFNNGFKVMRIKVVHYVGSIFFRN